MHEQGLLDGPGQTERCQMERLAEVEAQEIRDKFVKFILKGKSWQRNWG